MKARKVVILFILGIVLVSAFACVGGGGPAASPTPTPTPTPTLAPTPTPTPTPMPEAEAQILEHHLVREDWGGGFSMTFVRGRVKNTGEVTLRRVVVSVKCYHEDEYIGSMTDGMYQLWLEPGEIWNFEVLVRNETTHYDISLQYSEERFPFGFRPASK